MTDVSDRNFGLLIAYVIPGFVVVATVGSRLPMIQYWLSGVGDSAPTVGGFLYATVAAVLTGMTLGAVRWLVLDKLHHRTGVNRPNWDFSKLQAGRSSFAYLAEMHFRYYEFFGHMLIATLLVMLNATHLARQLEVPIVAVWCVLIGVGCLFFVASRDSLRKYYDRTSALLGRADSAHRQKDATTS